MTLLTRYLIRQNVFLLFTILLIATGIYLLTDLFERLDNFLEAEIGFKVIMLYFIVKIPMIISQLFPAVFLIAFIIQFNLLQRSKELVALYAGGISPGLFLRFLLLYGIFWGGGQFLFTEVAGIEGDRMALEIWKGEVRGSDKDSLVVRDLSFVDNNRIVHIEAAVPGKGHGTGLVVYVLDDTGLAITEVLKAAAFTISPKKWTLTDITRVKVQESLVENLPTLEFAIKQDLKDFQLVETWTKPEQLPLWELGKRIQRLQSAGSNVESLQTIWYAKIAYAASILVMGVLALAISQKFSNIYQAIGFALVCVFIVYAFNTFCVSLGKNGMTSPLVAAWACNVSVLAVLGCFFLLPTLRRLVKGE